MMVSKRNLLFRGSGANCVSFREGKQPAKSPESLSHQRSSSNQGSMHCTANRDAWRPKENAINEDFPQTTTTTTTNPNFPILHDHLQFVRILNQCVVSVHHFFRGRFLNQRKRIMFFPKVPPDLPR